MEYKAALEKVSRRAQRDLVQLFESLNLDNPLGSRNMLTQSIPGLVNRYGDATAQVAREWYDELRAIEGVPGGYRAALGEGISKEFIEARVKYGASHLFTDNPGGMLPFLEGAVQKYVLDYGRNTITRNVRRDPRAAGWMRVTSADPCKFCIMLAGRGGVYRRTTVAFAAHDDCNCAAMPSWNPNAKEVDVELYKVSERRASMSDAERDLQNERIRQYINQMG